MWRDILDAREPVFAKAVADRWQGLEVWKTFGLVDVLSLADSRTQANQYRTSGLVCVPRTTVTWHEVGAGSRCSSGRRPGSVAEVATPNS